MHRVAHFGSKQADDLPVTFHVAAGLNGFTETLETAVGTGKDAPCSPHDVAGNRTSATSAVFVIKMS